MKKLFALSFGLVFILVIASCCWSSDVETKFPELNSKWKIEFSSIYKSSKKLGSFTSDIYSDAIEYFADGTTTDTRMFLGYVKIGGKLVWSKGTITEDGEFEISSCDEVEEAHPQFTMSGYASVTIGADGKKVIGDNVSGVYILKNGSRKDLGFFKMHP
jgi:hypothetical protein